MATRTAIINVMAKACYKASRNLLRDFGEVEQLQTSRKGPENFVKTADEKSKRKLLDELCFARPDYGIIVKGGGLTKSNDPKNRIWIVDSLNGSKNFSHGIPHWAVSIALEEDQQIVASVIYDATRDELFWSEKGLGAYLNDTRLRVSERRHLSTCFLSVDHIDDSGSSHIPEKLLCTVNSTRNFGSEALDLAYVAAGRIDASLQSDARLWEIAAGILMVREAGGYVTDPSGKPKISKDSTIISANTHIHHELLKILRL